MFTKLTKSVLNVSALPDKVENQAKQLKATFDQAGVDIKDAFNGLVTELEANTSASNIGAKTSSGSTSNVQTELTGMNTKLNNKVEKVLGKQLSTEDFTTAEKTKLANVAENANNYVLPLASETQVGGVQVDGVTTKIIDGKLVTIGQDAADFTARAGVEELRETKADKTALEEGLQGKANIAHNQPVSSIIAGTFSGQMNANEISASNINSPQVRDIYAYDTDIVAGQSPLDTGKIYLVYE